MATAPAPLVTMRTKITLADAGRIVSKSPSCVFRWIRDGVRGERLAHIRMGRSIYTSEAALEDFGRRVAEARTRPAAVTPSPDRELVEAGL